MPLPSDLQSIVDIQFIIYTCDKTDSQCYSVNTMAAKIPLL